MRSSTVICDYAQTSFCYVLKSIGNARASGSYKEIKAEVKREGKEKRGER